MKFQTEKPKKAIINITSLIDVVLLLLIFFMISSTFIEQPGIKLDLPGTKTVELEPIKDLTLTVTADGKIYLSGSEINLSVLPDSLISHIQRSTDKKLTIKADENVPHGKVVEIMDIAKSVGVEKLIVATKVKE